MYESDLYRNFGKIKPSSIAVIGDVILDHYLRGELNRVSPEAPVGVLNQSSDEYRLGGAANVACNLAKLNCTVSLVGMIGTDEAAKVFKNLLKSEGIASDGLFVTTDRPTIRKTRLMAGGQQLMRVDREKNDPLPDQIEKKVIAWFKKSVKKFDGIIISDYNKGFLTGSLLKNIIAVARKNRKPIVVDPKGDSFAKYKGADVITPNRLELEKVSGIKCDNDKAVEKAARKVAKANAIKSVLATRGADGMALFTAGKPGWFFPTIAQEVFDVTGAGDTVVAVYTWARLGGLQPDEAARLSNHAGGLQVAHLGAVSIGVEELEESLANLAGKYDSKVINLAEATEYSLLLKRDGKKVVFTNGCFDLIHYGHIKYLQETRKMGDALILGLNSDKSLKNLKGPGRPVLKEHDRAHILAALDCVDAVVVFGEPTPIKLIKGIKPDILIKGGDYDLDQIVGSKEVKKWGGKVATVPYIEGSSTSGLIRKIVRSNR